MIGSGASAHGESVAAAERSTASDRLIGMPGDLSMIRQTRGLARCQLMVWPIRLDLWCLLGKTVDLVCAETLQAVDRLPCTQCPASDPPEVLTQPCCPCLGLKPL